MGSNKVPKLLQGLLRKPGEQRGGAGPGVHHVKLEEEETTYLTVRGQIRSPKQIQGLLRKPGEQLLTLGCLSLTDQSKQQPMFVLMRS